MNYQVIRRFIDSVRQKSRSRSVAFSMTMEQAQDLSNELSLMIVRENELLNEINELTKAKSVTEIVIGGGSFK
jgi:hypothetical protein